jgi:hypothetical protein
MCDNEQAALQQSSKRIEVLNLVIIIEADEGLNHIARHFATRSSTTRTGSIQLSIPSRTLVYPAFQVLASDIAIRKCFQAMYYSLAEISALGNLR